MTVPTERSAKWSPAERERVTKAIARASISLYEYDKLSVPEWIRDAAEGRPSTPPPE